MVGVLVMLVAAGFLVWALGSGRKGARNGAMVAFGIGIAFTLMEASVPAGYEPPVRSSVSRSEVEAGCYAFVKEHLVAPSTARIVPESYDRDPVFNPDAFEWTWRLEVESQNAFGVPIQSEWACSVRDDDEVRVSQLR